MILLVTGGAGFIGGNFIHETVKNHPDDTIICVDKLTYAGNIQTLDGITGRENFYFERADIADVGAIRRIFEKYKPDVVVNFAAESHVDRSISDPGIFIKTNVVGTQVLLDMSREFGVLRYHQVSTDEVYGDLPLGRPDLLFTEDTPLHTSSPYSASKAGADLLCMAYSKTYKIPITISRCSNNYGPYHFPEKLIPLMITNAMTDKPLPVYGQGLNIRDWLHVADHCKAIDLIIRKGNVGEVYNVGGNAERRNIDVVKAILRQLDKPESLIHFISDRPGHDLRYAIDASKMARELCWQPQVDFETGLYQTIQWYKDNRDWWNNILTGKYRELGEEL